MATPVRYYDPDKNPEGAYFAGVPLADLDEDTWASLPEWMQETIDSSGFWRKSRPPAARKESAVAEKESDHG